MTEWDEVKRLAADFQKVQLGSSSQRLSERNCIEIISWLREKNMIDLIFTTDGKDCLTPDQLMRDMQDEIYASGGRIDVVDLAKIIGVDLAHVNNHLNNLLKYQKNLNFIYGQLIDSTYVNKIIIEINEKLTAQGQINVNDLSIQYDLPGEFLQQILEKNLNKTLLGKQDKNDPKIFFTEYFIARNISKMRGALFAITKPTSVSSILGQIDVAEKLFFSIFDQVSACGSLTSRMAGAQYIPDIHSKSVHEWVSTFFAQNSYLEYDTLKKLGVNDHESYVKKQFQSEKIIFLNSCLISMDILDRLLDEVEDCISSKTYIDVPSILPSVFNDEDISSLLEQIMTPQRKQQIIVLDDFVVSLAFLDNLMELCKPVMEQSAKECVDSGKYQEYKMKLVTLKSQKTEEFEEKVDKREERRKRAAGGKSGGGTQGRETKTKSTKKNNKGNAKNLDTVIVDNERKEILEVLSREDVEKSVTNALNHTGLDSIFDSIIDHIWSKTNVEALKLAENIYATTVVDQTANRRHTHNDLQQRLNNLIGDIRLFEKGVKLLPEDSQSQLYKYLLKTVCTDVVNEILSYVAQELNTTVNLTNNDQRSKFVNELKPEYRNSILPLLKSLSSTNIDDFMSSIDDALASCSMILKKIDKKKDRVVILNHKHELLDKLNKCDDLALVLHLATLVIFTTSTQCMLHCSGRHLQQILKYLKQFLSPEQYAEFMSYHDYVSLMLSGGSEEENVRQKLKEMVPTVRNIANEFKKPQAEKS